MATLSFVNVVFVIIFYILVIKLFGVENTETTIPGNQERIKGTEKASPIHTLFHR